MAKEFNVQELAQAKQEIHNLRKNLAEAQRRDQISSRIPDTPTVRQLQLSSLPSSTHNIPDIPEIPQTGPSQSLAMKVSTSASWARALW
eukprot:2817256-Amphidinium_carterae.1